MSCSSALHGAQIILLWSMLCLLHSHLAQIAHFDDVLLTCRTSFSFLFCSTHCLHRPLGAGGFVSLLQCAQTGGGGSTILYFSRSASVGSRENKISNNTNSVLVHSKPSLFCVPAIGLQTTQPSNLRKHAMIHYIIISFLKS